MVTVVTVTNTSAFIVRKHLVEREEVLGERYKLVALLLFAYTHTIVRLYPNDCAPIPNLKAKKY